MLPKPKWFNKVILSPAEAFRISQQRQCRIVRVRAERGAGEASAAPRERGKAKRVETWNIFDLIGHDAPRPNSLPSLAAFKQFTAARCIREQEVLLFFDDDELLQASRLFWLFALWGKSCRLVNAHSSELQREGFLFEEAQQKLFYRKGAYPFFTAPLQPSFDSRPLLTLSRLQMLLACRNRSGRTFATIDTRSPEVFNLAARSPEVALRENHLPHSLNLFYRNLLADDGRLKDEQQLSDVLELLALSRYRYLVLLSENAISATLLFVVLTHFRYKNVAVYNGSWAEYKVKRLSPTE